MTPATPAQPPEMTYVEAVIQRAVRFCAMLGGRAAELSLEIQDQDAIFHMDTLRLPHSTSGLFADLTGFPPTLLQSGTRDLFLSNTVRMHRRLRDAGVDAELHVWEAMPHGGFGGAPEDLELVAEVRRFVDRVLGRV